MLSRTDAKYNFLTFQVYSWMHYLPFKVDRKAAQIELQSICRRHIFYANYFLAVLYYLNFTRTLIMSLFSKTKVPFNHFSVHTCFTLGLSTEIFRITAFLFAPHEIVMVFNETFRQSSADMAQLNKPRGFWQLSGRERLTRVFILVPIIIPFGYFAQVLQDPTRSHVLARSLGFVDPSSAIFKSLLVAECYFLNFVTSTLTFIQFVQLSAFEKISAVAKQKTRDTKYTSVISSRELYRSYSTCRRLQLLCKLENKAFATIAYVSKVLGLFTVVFNLFYAIRLVRSAPVDSINNAINGVLVFATFLGIYDKAYLVQNGISSLKREMQVKCREIAAPAARAEIMCAVRSLRDEGIRIGRFYNVEREATLISISFIVAQVTSLLVAIKRHE